MKDKNIDWQQREQELISLCNRYRSRNGSYDCIVPGSGGKDSTFTAHVLKFKYGMNPLTVAWAPHIYTEIGWNNFQKWIHSGLDNYLYTPNGKLHRLLTKLAFENLVHPFQPFIIGQRLIGPRFSALYGIPLVFYGENQAEYGNNIQENDSPTMSTSFYESTRDIDSLYLGGLSVKELISIHKLDVRDLNPYLPVEGERLKQIGTQVHYLGYYLKWDPQECFYYAAEHTGFRANTERTEGSYSKYSSIDDKIDPLHYYTTYIKFGIGRATYDAAQEIRTGKITRDEGVALVHRYDAEFPAKYFREIIDYMGITEERFWEIINKARSPHLWEHQNGEWKLRYQVS
jgi:N-acetyl sugar amidotransferase